MAERHILVVDDDPDIRGLLRELLDRRGFSVAEAGDGQEALRVFFDQRPDLVVLDVAMPGLDGWQTLERIRELSDVPVVMLTARATELEKTRGLRAGADDYVTKPFGMAELLARLRAAVRRATPADPEDLVIATESFTVDLAAKKVNCGGSDIRLTPAEWHVLEFLVRNSGRLVTQKQLLQEVWGPRPCGGDQLSARVYGAVVPQAGEGPFPSTPPHHRSGYGIPLER
jgi:two-component system, OmpR family, KDP operon response regulator KdpE